MVGRILRPFVALKTLTIGKRSRDLPNGVRRAEDDSQRLVCDVPATHMLAGAEYIDRRGG